MSGARFKQVKSNLAESVEGSDLHLKFRLFRLRRVKKVSSFSGFKINYID